MTAHTLLLVAGLALGFHAQAGGNHSHGHAPRHGGVVSQARDLDFELVIKADTIGLYVRDHDKPVDLTGATARLNLLSGNHKHTLELTPAGDKLAAASPFKSPASAKTVAVAVVTLKGKPTTVRFVLNESRPTGAE